MAKRVDANQAEIVDALRAVGCSVTDCHEMGRGYPDLSVGRAGRTYLLEVKAPGANLNSREMLWHLDWLGHVAIVHDVDEALRAVGLEDE